MYNFGDFFLSVSVSNSVQLRCVTKIWHQRFYNLFLNPNCAYEIQVLLLQKVTTLLYNTVVNNLEKQLNNVIPR